MSEDRRDAGEKKLQEQLHLSQRRAINNAYASLQGQKTAETFAAFTFEEAVDAQIERIEGKDTQNHPNLLNRLERIRGELSQAVAELKDVPPETFLDMNVTNAVNTPSNNDDAFWDEWAG